MLKRISAIIFIFLFLFSFAKEANAQRILNIEPSPIEVATDEADLASPSAKQKEEIEKRKQEDLTIPEKDEEKRRVLALLEKREVATNPQPYDFMAFFVQYAVRSGVPANTIILILLLPALATMIVILRDIVGIPSLEMLVPITLSIALIATGAIAGVILLSTILFASIVARFILKKIRIMQLPKMALSILIVSLSVFAALVVSASFGLIVVTQISFFPVLMLILLSDKIVGLQLARGKKTALIITFFTLLMGVIGYAVLSVQTIRSYILLYPEIVFLLIPINILLGRYFGLRLTEFHRFQSFRRYVNQ